MNFSPDSIKALRLRTGMTQLQFAELVGVSRELICHWENGRYSPRAGYSQTRLIYLEQQFPLELHTPVLVS